jgi:glycosyltransferase involved in cell wall biosynthesis
MSITVIILTYNESLHIKRCIESIKKLHARILVIDSFSNDDTCKIAESLDAEVYQNPFVNQAIQFQWAMDNCNIDSKWVLRLDADETIDNELVTNIKNMINNDTKEYNGAIFYRKHIFLGKWIKHGGRYPLAMLRLFRNGCAHIEQRWMDEHIILDKGKSVLLEGGFEDNNLNSVSWFIDKHNKYATREMIDIILKELLSTNDEISKETGFKIKFKRFLKQNIYMKLPYFVRPLLYFLYRYFIQLGFLDGAKGFGYHFMQGFWYRALVDLKCIEVKIQLNQIDSTNKKIDYLSEYSGFNLDSFKVNHEK